ncbi:MAG: hypothetical protein AAGF07_02085, partial [Patescibacteria group bacterium]
INKSSIFINNIEIYSSSLYIYINKVDRINDQRLIINISQKDPITNSVSNSALYTNDGGETWSKPLS